jgi:predicted ribosomally synthesized peptide with SipW-like signal peptide
MKRKQAGKAALLLAVAAVLIGGVYAYLTDSTQTQQNTLLLGENEIEVVETFDPDTAVETGDNIYDKKVQVKNTGNVDCYVRIYVGFTDEYARKVSGFAGAKTDGTYYSTIYDNQVEIPDPTLATTAASGNVEESEDVEESGDVGESEDREEAEEADDGDSSADTVETYWASVDEPDLDEHRENPPEDLSMYVNPEPYTWHLPDGWVYEPEQQHMTWNVATDSEDSDDSEDSSESGAELSAEEIAKNVKIAMGGWFYYTEPLAPGELTPALFDKVRTYFADENLVTPYDIIVYAESVQIKGIDGDLIKAGQDADGTVIPAWKAAWTDFLTRAYDKQIESYTLEAGDE